MKTILLHIADEASLSIRLETALAIARPMGGHLRCLQVTPIESYVAMDSLGGVFVMSDLLKAVEEQESALKSRVEQDLSNEDVSFDFRHTTGAVPGAVASYAALADVVISGREAKEVRRGAFAAGLADIVEQSRTPVLVCGDQVFDPFAPAMIAWNGSFEASAALKGAVPLLQKASAVHVVSAADEPDKAGTFPPTLVLEYLSRYGIKAELRTPVIERHRIANALLGEAEAVGAGLLVMGAYGHSRIGEYLLGGVTRTMLAACKLPLLMAR